MTNSDFEGYRVPTKLCHPCVTKGYEPFVALSKDIPTQVKEFKWGKMYYKFTPFDVIYTAYDSGGKEIKSETLEFPIENERDTIDTIRILGKRIEDLLKNPK